MYGPKDAPEAIAEYLQAEEAPLAPTRAITRRRQEQIRVKARQNMEELEEAVCLYRDDPAERRALMGHGQLQASEWSGPEGSSKEADTPVSEPSWHAQGSTKPAVFEPVSMDVKRKSQPLRKVPRISSGSGMQYKPREVVTPAQSYEEYPSKSETDQTMDAEAPEPCHSTKRRSQPFRRVAPKIGRTIHIGQHIDRRSPVGPVASLETGDAEPTDVRTQDNRD